MKQTELPFSPKRSPIYNKITQLLSAILIMVLVLSFWNIRNQINISDIDQHVSAISEQHLATIESGLYWSLVNNKPIEPYIEQVAAQPWLQSVHWYGPSGELLAQSDLGVSINALYQLDGEGIKKSKRYLPFIKALYTDSLMGYVRITVDKQYLAAPLLKSNEQNMGLIRLSLLFAGLVGFLLTRGVNRFSRQGFRYARGTHQQGEY